MKNSGRWLLFGQHLLVPKHVTLPLKIRFALPVSSPASCFFDRQAARKRNCKAVLFDLRTETGRSPKPSLSISQHCKKTANDTKWLDLLEPFWSLLHVWLCRVQVSYFHSCRGKIYQFQLVRVLALIHPLNWKLPCPKSKRTRKDAIPKRQGTFFNPHLSRQSVNCYGQDNAGCCEYCLPEIK